MGRSTHRGLIATGLALAALGFVAVMPGCAREDDDAAQAITVYAAASTTEFITDVARRFERDTGIAVRLNFASSAALARQIEHGAEAHVFVSANPQWMDHLAALDRIEPGSRRDALANRLVIVTPVNTPEPTDALTSGRIAIGDPDSVPAGIYAREALENTGRWDPAQPRIVPCVDVRAALRLVEYREATAGLVYASDAVGSDDVRVAEVLPASSHAPIVYPVAVVRDAPAAARDFAAMLLAPATDDAVRRHGFERP